jgi:hypothetical protein
MRNIVKIKPANSDPTTQLKSGESNRRMLEVGWLPSPVRAA